LSTTLNRQVPDAEVPSTAVSGLSGRNDPVYGGLPLAIVVAASSSNVVCV
jgi:hypothetical protein